MMKISTSKSLLTEVEEYAVRLWMIILALREAPHPKPEDAYEIYPASLA
jgi:hypothetical protein